MKEVCKLTTLELRMWNNEIQIGMLWDKNIDSVIEKSLVIERNNVIHKTSRYNVIVCRMTVKECTAQWPSFTVLHMKGSPENLQIVTHLKPKSIYTTYRIMNEKCRLETAKSKVKLESVVIDCSEQHSWENVLLCACIIYI